MQPLPSPCLAIAGPTASGKTALALALAQRMPCEIISVDSALVYRGMDIGTAKPTETERAGVPHHLIDIRDPLQAYSAAEFVRDASTLIAQIHARSALPVLVGGTMLYFKTLFEGLDPLPGADPVLRERLDQEAREHGWQALHARLAQIDPATAQRLAPHDSQRIQRALEVYYLSGQPLSQLHTRNANRAAQPLPCALISLEPTERSWLHARIAQRFMLMLEQGLLDEITRLRQRGDLHPALASMRCVGYRQAWEALDGAWPMGELPERGIAATRQLAKRQITWLRSMPQRQIFACDSPQGWQQALDWATRYAQDQRPSP
ncbi:MAG: tRNA (adenosine(37)-N6)-dimethylallyltransferase MiaA [Rhodoferax sp.]